MKEGVERLKKAYEAVEMLKALNLPVSFEQQQELSRLENEYITNEIIPLMIEEFEPFFEEIKSERKFELIYSPEDGLAIIPKESSQVKTLPESRNISQGERDLSKYSFNGKGPFNKRRFVLEVIKDYVRTHPSVTLMDLENRFPSILHTTRINGVVRKYEDVMQRVVASPDLKKRFFLKPDEIIHLADGTRVTVHNQWGSCFPAFLEVAEQLYDIQKHNN